jgi:RNA polymerase subunit RPABC4/transcription elongation factor Spt4
MIRILFADTTTTTGNDGLFDGVNDFFDSSTWLVIRNLSIFFVAVFWLASAYWVYKDARRRIEDPWLVAMATLLGLVPPFLGPLVYLFFRPPEYLEDVRERELEIRAMEERLGQRESHCPVCRAAVEPEFLICPVCTTKLKQACASCKAPLEPLWQVCPFCETPIVRQTPVFEETMVLSTEERRTQLRTPRQTHSGWEENTAERLEGDQ